MADILEVETGRHPENVDALAELGHVYTRQRRYALGLAVDQKLVRLVPDNPTVHYNLACSLAILGEKEGALDALERAVRLGYDDPAFMQQDEDLRRLRQESRFIELVRRLEEARG
jgi:Flp pilus assembly protein TadD